MRLRALLCFVIGAILGGPMGAQTDVAETPAEEPRSQFSSPRTEAERLRERLLEAQLEIREVNRQRERELREVLLVVLLIGGAGAVLLFLLYRHKLLVNRGLSELNARLGQKQEALRAANEQLERLNHEMNDVLSVVSHDLKNPLVGIEGLARELRSGANLIEDSQREAMIEMIEDSARRMFGLVSNLLDLQRIEAGHHGLRPQPCDLAAIARAAAHDLSLPARRKNQRIEISGPSELWVKGDEAALMRVINNLLSNALKYSPPSTCVRVQLDDTEMPALRITDQGPGIRPEEISRLFRKFSRLSTRPTGGESSSGLGLAIARGIIDALGGRIWCESAVGQGATFCFSLPASRRAAAQEAVEV